MKKNYKAKFGFIVLVFFSVLKVAGQQTYTFTNCSATGSLGPTQNMVNTAYLSTNLSGAVGTTTWTLLPWNADWRWMLTRTDSPWYPTMRLFRQECDGDWSQVIDQVAACLDDWARQQRVARAGRFNLR